MVFIDFAYFLCGMRKKVENNKQSLQNFKPYALKREFSMCAIDLFQYFITINRKVIYDLRVNRILATLTVLGKIYFVLQYNIH